MDYEVFKSKIKKPEPPAPAPKPAAPPPESPPPPPHQGPGAGPIGPFMGGGYMEDLDRMSRIPGMRDFEVTYSKTYRWNLMDPMEDYYMQHHYHGQQPMAYRGMQWLPPPHTAQAFLPPPNTAQALLPPPHAARALPPPPPRRLLGPPPEYGPPGMILAPPHHQAYDYPWAPPAYGPYGGGGIGYYDDKHPEDCRVM